ncbi:immunoglobulin-like domain-containing protein [Faecalicoccus pleomorphus]|uniref:immunoglobulin-like domain-containing protein n=1 Tax=Faecalicoccus pleomorphus TaxID=1323 RepID=UPI002943086F|nr:immunoglobulin-like domain-containing protein [Faecalicoccus pleomorphus]
MNDKIIKVGKTSLAAVVSALVGFSILDTTVLADEQNADSTVTEVQEDLVVNEEPNLETVLSEEQNLETSVSKEVPMKETESVQPMAANDNPVIMVMDTSVGDENGYTRLDLHFYDADLVDYVTINGVYRDLENDDDSNLNDQNAGYVNGTNTVVVYDVLGNSSTFTFNYIKASEDTTPPTVVSITYSNDNGNKVTKEDVVVTITANENLQPVDGWTVSGNVMTKTHSENGKYSVVMKDLAGNETIVNYEVKRIDKVPPVIEGITEGMVTNQDVTYTIIEQSISQIIIDGTVYNEKNAPKTITDEGLHTIKVIDKAGNETSVSFTIDRIGPTITGKEGSVGQDGIYSKIDLKLYDANKVDYVLINGKKKDLTDNTWSDVNFKDVQYKEGKNVVEAFDIAGNSSTFEFILDTKGPEITVKDSSIGKDGVYSRLDLKFYDANKVDYVEVNGVKKDLIDNVWSDVNGKDVQYKEGKNIVVAYDQAGNSSTFEFIYDTKGPEITVKDSSIGKDGVYSRLDLKFYDANKVDYVEVNGKKIELSDNTWSDLNDQNAGYIEGENTVICYDIAGNATEFTFIYDKTAPVIEANDRTINVGDDIDLMEGVSAYDGTVDLTNSIEVTGTVDNTKSGQYEITYKVTDQAGNTTEKKITITVNALPAFHADDITIALGDAFDPMQGVSAQDEEDGDLTDQIVIESNNVDVNVAGEYTIVYRITDKSGASVTYTRNVTVEAPDTPVNPENPEDSTKSEDTNKPSNEDQKPGETDKDSQKVNGTNTAASLSLATALLGVGAASVGVVTLLKNRKKK